MDRGLLFQSAQWHGADMLLLPTGQCRGKVSYCKYTYRRGGTPMNKIHMLWSYGRSVRSQNHSVDIIRGRALFHVFGTVPLVLCT